MELIELWRTILKRVKSEVTPSNFEIWFKNTELREKNEDELVVYAANEFAVEWLNKHYKSLIENIASEIQGKETKVSITSVNGKKTPI